jgi:hypothetical protein
MMRPDTAGQPRIGAITTHAPQGALTEWWLDLKQ